MNFRLRSERTRITLVTSPYHDRLSRFLGKCNHHVEKWLRGKNATRGKTCMV
jgi:hypothetical protein